METTDHGTKIAALEQQVEKLTKQVARLEASLTPRNVLALLEEAQKRYR